MYMHQKRISLINPKTNASIPQAASDQNAISLVLIQKSIPI